MIDLLNLPANEAERLAYAEGATKTAELFARLAELEEKLEQVEDELDTARTNLKHCAYHDEYRQFFYDCFDRLAGHYPAPEPTSGHDKSIIFDAIERGERLSDDLK